MNEKILWQIQDTLRRTRLPPELTLELALQLLAWVKLSNTRQIAEDLQIDSSVLSEPTKAITILTQLGQGKGAVSQAFTATSRLDVHDALVLQPALDLVMRLNASGVLLNVNPSDLITHWGIHSAADTALPSEVADLMVRLAAPKSTDTAYVPWDFSAQLASRLSPLAAEVYLEQPQQSPISALVSILSESPFDVHYADPIRAPSAVENGRPRRFDIAVAFPPLLQRYDLSVPTTDWFGRFPERTSSGAVLAVRHLLSQARRRIVVAVPNGVLFSAGAELKLREDLIQAQRVIAVIGLPSGLLRNTNLAFSLLVLDPTGSSDRIHFINADSPRHREAISKAKNRLTSIDELLRVVDGGLACEDAVCVPASDVLRNDAQLQVGRYVLPDSKRLVRALLATAQTLELSEIVDSFRPPPPTSADGETIEVIEVGAAELPPFGYITQPTRAIQIDAALVHKTAHAFLRPLDIVLIVKGSVGKIGIVPPNVPEPGPGAWVAGQSAIVLRQRDNPQVEIDPRVLLVQLRSPIGQELLTGIVSGASIPLIQLRELMRLPVPLPDPAQSSRAISALDREASIQMEIDLLSKRQAEVAAGLWTLTGTSSTGPE